MKFPKIFQIASRPYPGKWKILGNFILVIIKH